MKERGISPSSFDKLRTGSQSLPFEGEDFCTRVCGQPWIAMLSGMAKKFLIVRNSSFGALGASAII